VEVVGAGGAKQAVRGGQYQVVGVLRRCQVQRYMCLNIAALYQTTFDMSPSES
jgi:hypothetical protein